MRMTKIIKKIFIGMEIIIKSLGEAVKVIILIITPLLSFIPPAVLNI
jgi:hypothetical protein